MALDSTRIYWLISFLFQTFALSFLLFKLKWQFFICLIYDLAATKLFFTCCVQFLMHQTFLPIDRKWFFKREINCVMRQGVFFFYISFFPLNLKFFWNHCDYFRNLFLPQWRLVMVFIDIVHGCECTKNCTKYTDMSSYPLSFFVMYNLHSKILCCEGNVMLYFKRSLSSIFSVIVISQNLFAWWKY